MSKRKAIQKFAKVSREDWEIVNHARTSRPEPADNYPVFPVLGAEASLESSLDAAVSLLIESQNVMDDGSPHPKNPTQIVCYLVSPQAAHQVGVALQKAAQDYLHSHPPSDPE